MTKLIGGYSVSQLSAMLRQQKLAAIQEVTTLRREIAARERRLAEAVAKLEDLSRAEVLLEDGDD